VSLTKERSRRLNSTILKQCKTQSVTKLALFVSVTGWWFVDSGTSAINHPCSEEIVRIAKGTGAGSWSEMW